MPVIMEPPNTAPAPSTAGGAIVIGLINNMPDGAIRSTEQQFLGLLGAASTGLDVRLRLYCLPDVPRSAQARSVLLRFYRDIAGLFADGADAVIMTGNEPHAPSLRQEPYWGSLARVFDWAEEHTLSAVWSCLAAHAAALHFDGVERSAFDRKLSGVFEVTKVSDHGLLSGTPERWSVPHSRQYGLAARDLEAADYRVLTCSETAGADIFVKQRRSMFVLLQGHLEYDPHSLFKEYVRDIGRFLHGESEIYPEMPHGYFDRELTRSFGALRAEAEAGRSPALLARLPAADTQGCLVSTWRAPAVTIYRNWLQWIVARKTAARRIAEPAPAAPVQPHH